MASLLLDLQEEGMKPDLLHYEPTDGTLPEDRDERNRWMASHER